jgi:hypothetical protein
MEISECERPDPIKIIYIMGSGRSGSTVLNTVLGNHPEVGAFGELANLVRSGWINNEYCSCGQKVNDCSFWSEVRQEWIARTGREELSYYVKLQDMFERFKSWPRLRLESCRPSKKFQLYLELTRSLFVALRKVSGKPVIVDSSKAPERAFALSFIPCLDLRFIHLVRDGRAVIWSYQKAFQRAPQAGIQKDLFPVSSWKTSLNWALVNCSSALVSIRKPARAVVVRYEDLVKYPKDTLARIGKGTGLNLTELSCEVESNKPLFTGHTVAGNRLRMKKTIRLDADFQWCQMLSRRDKIVFLLLAGWLAKRYRYNVWNSRLCD